MRALLSVPVLTRSCLRRVAYRQEVPPPGGYPDIPWRRNIPQRGYGFIACLVCGFSTFLTKIFLKPLILEEFLIFLNFLFSGLPNFTTAYKASSRGFV